MEERCGLGFKQDRGLVRGGFNEKSIPPQRTGPVKKGEANTFSRKPANTQKKACTHLQTRLLSNEAPTSPFLSFYLQPSVPHTGSRVNQLQSRPALSAPRARCESDGVLTSRPTSTNGCSHVQSKQICCPAAGWLTYSMFAHNISWAAFTPSALHRNNAGATKKSAAEPCCTEVAHPAFGRLCMKSKEHICSTWSEDFKFTSQTIDIEPSGCFSGKEKCFCSDLRRSEVLNF